MSSLNLEYLPNMGLSHKSGRNQKFYITIYKLSGQGAKQIKTYIKLQKNAVDWNGKP